ncbi:hypothetical protein T01_10377 [Trichinella spiralis]|uniref:Uncharacterized protein n=1 Tax=Trichinella spiralis TaxID=6334 RepID=A0A0V1BW73_TRISP|nr:hypothetical protein T01_10377 [Trichinella spiralis]
MNISNEKMTNLASLLVELNSAFLLFILHLRHRLEFIFSKKLQCTKTGFQRCAMQITIAIKVPYRQLGRTRSFDLRGKW